MGTGCDGTGGGRGSDGLTVAFDAPRGCAFECGVPGHRENGMEGTISVA